MEYNLYPLEFCTGTLFLTDIRRTKLLILVMFSSLSVSSPTEITLVKVFSFRAQNLTPLLADSRSTNTTNLVVPSSEHTTVLRLRCKVKFSDFLLILPVEELDVLSFF